MPSHPTGQSPTIARFLSLAREHFGLDERPATPLRPRRKAAHHVRRGLLRSLLIAGSIGGLLGNTAYAGNGETAAAKSRTERSASGRSGGAESAVSKALERMP